MRRTGWLSMLMILAVVFGSLALRPAEVAANANAEFLVHNETGWWLTLYLNGEKALSVPPRDRRSTPVPTGWYAMRAVTPDGRVVQRYEHIDENGLTWTIYEE